MQKTFLCTDFEDSFSTVLFTVAYLVAFRTQFWCIHVCMCWQWMRAGQNVFNENETIAKYEIMDGAPVRGMYSIVLHCTVTLTGIIYVLPRILNFVENFTWPFNHL